MKDESRLKNSIYNTLANLFLKFGTTILSFIIRTYFIHILGEQLLGLDGLLTNILSLLSLAELGFSTAISFSLYKPLAKKDNEKVSQLITYFKKIYQKIALFILIVGLCLLPFLKYIVKDYTASDNIYLIYILYLINTVSSYFVSYSATLIEADQKYYETSKIVIFFDLLTSALQLIALLIFKNFILYLVVQFFARFIQRVVTNNYIQKKYKDINFKTEKELSKTEKNKIKNDIKGLLFHRIGDYAVNSTDNILISSIVNISTTGIYSNYLSLISVVKGLISSVMVAPTSSMGNLNVKESPKVKNNVFDMINYLCYFISGIATIGVYFCINNFITIWIGEKFLLSQACVFLISLNLYLTCVILPITTMKNATGLYYIDRYVPVLQAIINLIVSIIAGIFFGIFGILLGTAVSYLFVAMIIKPYYVYKYVFQAKVKTYYLYFIKNVLVLVFSALISYIIIKSITLNNILVQLLFNGIVSVLVYIIIFILISINSKEFKYFKGLFINLLKKERV